MSGRWADIDWNHRVRIVSFALALWFGFAATILIFGLYALVAWVAFTMGWVSLYLLGKESKP